MSDLRAALAEALGPLYRIEREVRPVGEYRLFVATQSEASFELLIKVLPAALSLGINDLQFERAQSQIDQFGWLPIVRLAKAISSRMASPPSSPSPDQTADDCKGSTHIAGLAERYRQSVEMARAISKLYGISTLFFLKGPSACKPVGYCFAKHAPFPRRGRQRPHQIQNNSGLPQGPSQHCCRRKSGTTARSAGAKIICGRRCSVALSRFL